MPTLDPEEDPPQEPSPQQPSKQASEANMLNRTDRKQSLSSMSQLAEEVKKFLDSLPPLPTPETLTPTDLIVCPLAEGPMYFQDDVTTACEGCGIKIRHRPPPESALRHVCPKCAVIDIRLAERKQRETFRVYMDHAGKPSK